MHRKNTGRKYTKTLTEIISGGGFWGELLTLLFPVFSKLSTMNIYYFYNGGEGKGGQYKRHLVLGGGKTDGSKGMLSTCTASAYVFIYKGGTITPILCTC